jgi:hypothetical protein
LIGGGTGSYFGAVCWHRAGWWGVCSFGAGVLSLALITEFLCSRLLGGNTHENRSALGYR